MMLDFWVFEKKLSAGQGSCRNGTVAADMRTPPPTPSPLLAPFKLVFFGSPALNRGTS